MEEIMQDKEREIRNYFDSYAVQYYERHSDKNLLGELMQRYLKYLLPTVKGKTTLETGCGTGLFSEYLVDYSKNFVGIDFSDEMIRIANAKQKMGHFLVADTQCLPFKSNSFDVVYSIRCLQHIPHYEKAIQEISRVLSGGGIAAFDFINLKNPFGFLRAVLFRPLKAEYLRANHHSQIHESCEEAGMEIIHTYPISFSIDPANITKYLPNFVAKPIISLHRNLNFELKESSFLGRFALRLLVVCRKSEREGLKR